MSHNYWQSWTNGRRPWTICLNLDAIYLDFSKAFDSVPHQHLLMKLEGYGICGTLLAWIKDFLVDRNQHMVINGMKSLPALLLSGIPQGSVLGPLLVILICERYARYITYSDVRGRHKIYREVNNPTEAQQLYRCIRRLDNRMATTI